MKLRIFLISFIILSLVIGCAKPPTEEMDSAKEAVFKAQNDANAVQYASGTLTRAQNSLRLMQSEADAKRYDAARTHAAEAIAAAERAITEGKAAAERVALESSALISSLRSEIDDTARNIATARYANLDLDYAALDRRIAADHDKTDQAVADQAAGRYQAALDTAREVRSDLFDINQIVTSAVPARKK
jgi:vacuolar-type H+-ATPase subunit D/Vma8